MRLLKQDKNGSRTPADIERKYQLGVIPNVKEEVESIKDEIVVDNYLSTTSTRAVQNKVITENFNKKVNIVKGKGLSTNDFTDEYKNMIDGTYIQSHTHTNKDVLDGITNTKINEWNNKTNFTQTTLYKSNTGEIGDVHFDINPVIFNYIDIEYGNVSNVHSVQRVYEPIGKDVSLSIASSDSSSLTIRTETIKINTSGITRGTKHKFVVNNSNAVSTTTSESITDSDKIIIYRVVGYNF